MTSSKRSKTRQPNQKIKNQKNAQSTRFSTNQPFEETQLRSIQVMVTYLANKAYVSMGESGSELKPEALAPLRLYAQYLNLYLKFKDKCFPNQEQIMLPHAPQIMTHEGFDPPKPHVPTAPTQKQNQSAEMTHTAEPNGMQHTSQSTALLMNPAINTIDLPLPKKPGLSNRETQLPLSCP